MWVVGCSSGAQFSASSGGSGGKAGSASGGSAGSSSGGAAGGPVSGDAGASCQWSHTANTCPDGYFCNAMNCQTGTCMQIPQNTGSDYKPACGCDGVTYWNPSIAAHFGVPIAGTDGVCPLKGAAICNSNTPCPPERHCDEERTQTACTMSTSTDGVCWGLPDSCPPGAPSGLDCGVSLPPTNGCQSKCELIKSDKRWFPSTCP